MLNIREVIEEKFDTALSLYSVGNDSLRSDKPILGPAVEVIALDSVTGPDSRCLLTRAGVGSRGIAVNGLDVLSFGVEIPRTKGDKRSFEELPPDAVQGNPFIIGIRDETQIEIEGDIRSDWLSVEGLYCALSGMRVAEKIPLASF